MIGCAWIQKRIVIPEDSRTWPPWIARHVGRCDACRRFVEETSAIRKALATEAPAEADEVAIRRIMSEIGRMEERRAPTAGGLEWSGFESLQPGWSLRLVLAAALILILAVQFAEMPVLPQPRGELASDRPAVSRPPSPALPARAAQEPIPALPRPVLVYIEPAPMVSRTMGPIAATTSNAPTDMEFGGVPVMPVSFDY